MKYFVYIIFSSKLNRYYVGSTSDIEDRFKKHNRNHKGYTATCRPWVLVYNEIFEDKAQALHREKQIKSWKSRERIEYLISS